MKNIVALLLLVSGTAFAEEKSDPHHVYRLDFVIAEDDAGKGTTATYTLNLQERRAGEIKMGSNVALAGQSGNQRADIGLLLRASYTSVGEDLLVEGEVEITAAKDAQSFRKMSAKGAALIAQGKPALVASVEDPITHKHYQVTATATKLR